MIRNPLSKATRARLIQLKSLLQNKFSISKQSSNAIQLTVEVIKKIMDPPIISQLQKQSSRDQILQIANNSNNTEWKETMKQFFQKGMKRNKNVFNQYRFEGAEFKSKDLLKDNKLIIFNPFNLIGSQILQQINNISKKVQNVNLLYGHHGSAKSFQYYQDQYLIDIIVKQLLKLDQTSRIVKIKQLKQQNIPIVKIFYWNMSVKETDQKFLLQMFLSQCPQIPSEFRTNLQNKSFKQCIQLINKFYENNLIQTFLVIDQINAIFSIFRQKIVAQYKKINPSYQTLEASKYQAQQLEQFYKICLANNKKRIQIQEYFSKIIFNSSVNIEARLESDDNPIYLSKASNLMQIQEQLHSQLLFKARLRFDIGHEFKINKVRIKYPQLLRLQSAAWELTDFVIFQLQKTVLDKSDWERTVEIFENGQNLYIDFKQYIRKIINKKMKQILENNIITPLTIRMSFEKNIKSQIFQSQFKVSNQFINEINQRLQILAQYSSQMQIKKLKSIGKKIPGIQMKNRLFLEIYSSINNILRINQQKLSLSSNNELIRSEQNQNQNQNQKLEKMVKQQTQNYLKRVLFFFFKHENQINMNAYKQFFDVLDQNTFISFKNYNQMKSYIQSVVPIAIQQLISNEKDQKRRSIIKSAQKQKIEILLQKYKNKVFPLAFILIPCQRLVNYLGQNLRNLIKNEKQLLKKFFVKKNMSGQGIEDSIVRALTLQKQKVRIKNKQIDFSNKQDKKFKSFPRVKNTDAIGQYQQQFEEENINKKEAQQFFKQFLAQSQSDTILFTPYYQNSKAIDFVICLKDRLKGTLQINYYDVTVSETKSNIVKKLSKFQKCLKYFNTKQQGTVYYDNQDKLRVINNFVIIANPKRIQKFTQITKKFYRVKQLLDLSQSEFEKSNELISFLKTLKIQYLKEKKMLDVRHINEKEFMQKLYKLFVKSLTTQKLQGQSGINQIIIYILKNFGKESFLEGHQNNKKLQMKIARIIFNQLRQSNKGFKINNFELVNLDQIQFSLRNQEYPVFQTMKQIERDHRSQQ